jgi:hypothetical protein
MTFKINSVPFVVQPSSHHWVSRPSLGFDGGGHPMYVAVRSYEMSWDFMNISGAMQIQNFYNLCSVSGTVIVDLPAFQAGSYVFKSYTGCVLQEPTFDTYFNEFEQTLKLVVNNIRTG